MSVDRRRFIVQTALGSAASLALGCTRSSPEPAVPHPSPEDPDPDSGPSSPLGVALLGLGQYSTEQLAPALQRTQHCKLRGIITGSPEKIPAWQREHGIAPSNCYRYETMHELADNDDIDVVYVVTPTSLHAKYTIAAAEAGKHVWCEKPMAMDPDECQAMIDACRSNGVKLSIGYRMQHEPNTQTIIRWADELPYGEITAVRAAAGYRGGGGTGWRYVRAMGGGALYDMGVYTINGIRYAVGEEPTRVLRATQSTARPELFGDVDETTEFELEFPSGLVAVGRTSVGEVLNELRVDCARGGYALAPMQTYTGVQGVTSDGKPLDQPIENQQARQMDDDALAILEDRDVMVPGEEGLADIRIVRAILETARSGTPTSV